VVIYGLVDNHLYFILISFLIKLQQRILA